MKNINKKFDIFMQEFPDYGLITVSHNIDSTYYKLLFKIIKLVRFEYCNAKINKNSTDLIDEFVYSCNIYENPVGNTVVLASIINLYEYSPEDIHGKSINILLMYLFPYIIKLYHYFNKYGNDISYYKSIKKLNELEYNEFKANRIASNQPISALRITILCNKKFYNTIKKYEKY